MCLDVIDTFRGYVYAGDLVIEKSADGRLHLLIANSERSEGAGDLCQLEADLYEYATHEGLL